MGRLTRTQKLEQELEVWDLLTKKHLTEKDIAQRLGITPKRVREIVERRTNETLADLRGSAKRYLVSQVHTYDWIAEEATEAWHRSKSNKVRVKKKVEPRVGSDGKIQQIEKVEEQHDINTVGDVRFLDAIVNSLVEQAKLLKLYDMTDEELDANKAEFSVDEIRKRLQTVLPTITVMQKPVKQITDSQKEDGDEAYDGDYSISDSDVSLSELRGHLESFGGTEHEG